MTRARSMEEVYEHWATTCDYEIDCRPGPTSCAFANACLEWILAERDYLQGLERELHKRQREQRRTYIKTLQWQVEEARWYAEDARYDCIIHRVDGTLRAIPKVFPWQDAR